MTDEIRWRETWTFTALPMGRECWVRWNDGEGGLGGPFPALGLYTLTASREGDAYREARSYEGVGGKKYDRMIPKPPLLFSDPDFEGEPEFTRVYVLLACNDWEDGVDTFALGGATPEILWMKPDA